MSIRRQTIVLQTTGAQSDAARGSERQRRLAETSNQTRTGEALEAEDDKWKVGEVELGPNAEPQTAAVLRKAWLSSLVMRPVVVQSNSRLLIDCSRMAQRNTATVVLYRAAALMASLSHTDQQKWKGNTIECLGEIFGSFVPRQQWCTQRVSGLSACVDFFDSIETRQRAIDEASLGAIGRPQFLVS
jgi:hypothetical protein